MGEFESRSVKTRDAVEGFHLLEVFTNRLWRHGQHVLFLYEIIIFSVNKKKDGLQSAYCKFS